MIGPFANALEDGAMGIFTTREAAEEFVRGDPFVLHGVIRNWTIREWNEALVPASQVRTRSRPAAIGSGRRGPGGALGGGWPGAIEGPGSPLPRRGRGPARRHPFAVIREDEGFTLI